MIAPRILGNATNIIVDGVTSGTGIDFDSSHRTCCVVLAIYSRRRSRSRSRRPSLLAGVVQRAMYRLRADVEDKLNRMPLATSTASPAATC